MLIYITSLLLLIGIILYATSTFARWQGIRRNPLLAIRDPIRSVELEYIRIFSDRNKINKYEVRRSKAFYQLGDDEEKIRSIYYIAFLGTLSDVEFLNRASHDMGQSEAVRHAATKAMDLLYARYKPAQ